MANPRFILRNWIVQEAIEQAERDDARSLHALLERIRQPYETQAGDARYFARVRTVPASSRQLDALVLAMEGKKAKAPGG